MKSFGLTVFLGFALVMTGCGKMQSMFKFGSSSQAQNPQIQAFSGLGNVVPISGKDLQIMLNADDIFRKNSDRLSKDGIAKVDAIARAVLKYQGDRVVVGEGIGAQNAKSFRPLVAAVKKELVRRGVGASNVSAAGAMSASNTADKAKNRRIVFEISAS